MLKMMHNILLDNYKNIPNNFRQSAAFEAHNLKVVGSNPTPATNINIAITTPYASLTRGFCVGETPVDALWKQAGRSRLATFTQQVCSGGQRSVNLISAFRGVFSHPYTVSEKQTFNNMALTLVECWPMNRNADKGLGYNYWP